MAPRLYLLWGGTDSGNPTAFGISCATNLPYFVQPQISWVSGSAMLAQPAMLALSDRILITYALKYPDSDVIGFQVCSSWPSILREASGGPYGNIPGAGSSWGTALAQIPIGALCVWNGLGSDTRLWSAKYNQAASVWTTQYLTALQTGAPIQSGSAPAMVNFNGLLILVWRGEGGNTNLYYATSADGVHWNGNRGIPNAASSIRPAMTIFNGAPVLVFKGSGDTGIYSTTYHLATDSWAPVVHTGSFGTSHGPSLAVYQGQLFMTWKGIPGDTNIYWAVTHDNLNPAAWSGQSIISNVGSLSGPGVVVF